MTRRRSTVWRLTALLATISVLVMAVLGIAIDQAVRHNFNALDRAELENKAALISDMAATVPPQELGQRLGEALGHHPDIAFWIGDADGKALFSTAPPSLLAYAQQHPSTAQLRQQLWRLPDGNHFIVLHFRQMQQGRPLTLLLAIDGARHAPFLRGFHQLLAACIILAAVASSLLGGYVVRRTLRPLQSLADEARQITTEHLDRRLSVGAAPAELDHLAQTLNSMLARLQNDFVRLSEFSADLSHELRTPITNLLTQVHVVLAQPRDNAAYRDALGSCAEEMQRLSRIVTDMLYLAQAETVDALPTRERVVLGSLVDALLEFYGLLAEDKQVQLQRDGDADLRGNRLMIHRAVANLLSNAIQHCPPGGVVQIRIRSGDGGCNIEVSNPGTPIPADVLPRLFDRFYRADRSRGRGHGEGAGLGLAITRAIAQAHGGQVQVISTTQATVFSLQLPLA
ncbi:MAG: two-component sensor histidine kinase [Shinella sp.]|jgi:two-component system heavy metal sensor histidine kinase CusS|nr:MAG: two-component sensor histidine kinase [Shinella sp.]